MRATNFYIAVVGMGLLGLAGSIFFFPSAQDTSLMYVYDKQYEKAYKTYQSLYDQGNHSVSVVVPLAQILFAEAKTDEATKILEDLVAMHPNSLAAQQLLAKIYASVSRPYDYLNSLDVLSSLSPNVEVLRQRKRYSRYLGDEQGEIDALEEIVKLYKATPQEYLELAYRYAKRGEKNKGAATIFRFLENSSTKALDLESAQLAIYLLAGEGFKDEVYRLALDAQKTHGGMPMTLALVYALQNVKMYDEALDFISTLSKTTQNDPTIISAKTGIYLQQKMNYLAYQYLLDQFALGNVPQNLMPDFVSLLLDYEDIQSLQDVVKWGQLETFPENFAVSIINTALGKNRADIIESFRMVLSPKYLASHSAAAIAFIIGDPLLDKDRKLALLKMYNNVHFSPYQAYLIASLYHTAGFDQQAKDMLVSIENWGQIPKDELNDVGLLYLDLNEEEAGWKIASKSLERSAQLLEMQKAAVLLGAAVGASEPIFAWVNAQKRSHEGLLQDAFYIAFEKKHSALAERLAVALNEIHPSQLHQQLLAEAFILNGAPEKAYGILKRLFAAGVDVLEPYIEALSALGKKGGEDLQILKDGVDDILKSKDVPDSSLREIGYLLVDAGEKEKAADVFYVLAQGKDFEAQDVKDLLGLWGEKLNDRQVTWLSINAKASKGKEKSLWLRHLLDTRNPSVVVGLVGQKEWAEDNIADVYAEALVAEKKKPLLEEMIAYLIPEESRLPRLRKFGKLAQDVGLKDTAFKVYHRVLDLEPNDANALLAMGEITYNQGKFTQAKSYLCSYLLGGNSSHLADYYLAEIALFNDDPIRARRYFQCALDKLGNLEKKDSTVLSVEAHTLYRLGRIDVAVSLYERLLIEKPDDLYLVADYASLLLDVDRFDRAREILFCWRTVAEPDPEAEAALGLAQLRYYKETLSTLRALCFSRELVEAYPKLGTVYSGRADVASSLGMWKPARRMYNYALNLEPENERYLKDRYLISAPYYPQIVFGREYRITGKTQKEVLEHYFVNGNASPSSRWFVEFERDNFQLDGIDPVEPRLPPTTHRERYRSAFRYVHDFWCGDTLSGALYYTPRVVGVGIESKVLDLRGATVYLAQYHRPNWDFTETIIQHGTRDLLGLTRLQRVSKRIEINVGGAFNRYNLEGVEGAAFSYSIEGVATFSLVRQPRLTRYLGQNYSLSLNYAVDAEYRTHERKLHKDDLPDPFIPLPLQNRQVHSLVLYYENQWTPLFALELHGGYGYDFAAKLHNGLPIYGGCITYGRAGCVGGSFCYTHSTSTQTSSETVDNLLFNLHIRW